MARSLDFVVIGAQKAGTTTLWELLRQRPDVWVPQSKEMPYFSDERLHAEGLEPLLVRYGAADDGRLIGTVTPQYMRGAPEVRTARIARRMAKEVPRLKLIALLRDPIERACSQHAMAAARGRDPRSLDDAIEAELAPAARRAARRAPGDANTYVVGGEYGRILAEYLSVFAREQLHVELTSRLADDPDGVLRRVLTFVGARIDDLPAQPRLRLFAGGPEARTSDAASIRLCKQLAAAPGEQRRALARAWAEARPELGEEDAVALDSVVERFVALPAPLPAYDRAGLRFAVRKVWNVRPGPRQVLRPDLRERLAAHYARDAARLREVTGVEGDW